MVNENVLEGWLNYKADNEVVKQMYLRTRQGEPETRDVSDDIYFDAMPNCNVSSADRELRFSECATDFIKALFDKFVDDDTLVITTTDEHDNEKACVAKCKNTLVLDYSNEVMCMNFTRVREEISKFHKIFVYVIGTQISTGEITPQMFFEKLKEILADKQSVLVLDDVHGMFLFPRDYRPFDFVLFTAHALLKGFDMGLLIKKKSVDFDFGYTMCSWALDYLAPLQHILSHRDKLFMFRAVMENYFADLLSTGLFQSLTRTSPHIFSMRINQLSFSKRLCEMLNEYKIRIENGGDQTFVRFRAQHYIQRPELFIEGVRKFRFVINELLNL